MGKASILRRTPSVSTPRSCVPSAEKVAFSTLSAFTNLRKSEYRTSTGAPPLLVIIGRSEAGAAGASIAIASGDIRAREFVGVVKAFTQSLLLLRRIDPSIASALYFMIAKLKLL